MTGCSCRLNSDTHPTIEDIASQSCCLQSWCGTIKWGFRARLRLRSSLIVEAMNSSPNPNEIASDHPVRQSQVIGFSYCNTILQEGHGKQALQPTRRHFRERPQSSHAQHMVSSWSCLLKEFSWRAAASSLCSSALEALSQSGCRVQATRTSVSAFQRYIRWISIQVCCGNVNSCGSPSIMTSKCCIAGR